MLKTRVVMRGVLETARLGYDDEERRPLQARKGKCAAWPTTNMNPTPARDVSYVTRMMNGDFLDTN